MKTIHIKVSFARWRFNWTRPRRATLPVSPSWPSSFLCRAVTRCQRLPCLALPSPHFFPFFQGIHFSLSLSSSTPLFSSPSLWPTFIKNFLLVEPRWSRFLCSVSIDIEPTIQSGTKRSESKGRRDSPSVKSVFFSPSPFLSFFEASY